MTSREPLRTSASAPHQDELAGDVFEHSFANAAIGLAIVGLDGRWIKVNRALCDMVGYDQDEMAERTFRDITHPDDLDEDMELVRRLLAGEIPSYEREKRYLRRDGTPFWIHLNVSSVRDRNGAPEYLISQMINIDRRKTAAEELRGSEARLAEAQEVAQIGSWEWDVRSGGVTWSNALYAIFGVEPSTFEPSFASYLSLVHPEDRARTELVAIEIGRTGTPMDNEHRIVRPDGEVRYLRSRATATLDAAGGVVRVTGTAHDITDLRLATLELERANEGLTRSVAGLQSLNHQFGLLRELSELLQHAPNADEVASVVSAIGRRLFPGSSGVLYLLGTGGPVSPKTSWGEDAAVSVDLDLEDCWSIRRGRLHVVEDANGIRCRHAEATVDPYVCAPLLARGEAQGFLHVRRSADHAGAAAEIAELAAAVAENVALALTNLRLREELKAQATRDPLTGLYNRRFMTEAFERELIKAARDQTPVSVVMMDLDRFKAVNDDHGHEAGDAVLTAVAEVLQVYVRGSDVVCRHGGEEFVLVLPGASAELAAERAASILEQLRALIVPTGAGSEVRGITASFGVAAAPESGTTIEDLLREADRALYRAKSFGRDRVECASTPGESATAPVTVAVA